MTLLSHEAVLRCAEDAGARIHTSGRVTVADGGISGAGAQFVHRFAARLEQEIQAQAPQSSFEDADAYWRHVLAHRMPQWEEVSRLTTMLYGFYARSTEGYRSVREFAEEDKRPYGNKSTADAIAFNLGWDFQRRLTRERLPDWVAQEAMALHEAVLAELPA